MSLLGVGALGCQPASHQSAGLSPAYPDNATRYEDERYAGELTVGLRVDLDPESADERRVRLVAVIRDINGEEALTDLGEYEGVVTEVEPVEGELMHVSIDDGVAPAELRLVLGVDGSIEVRLTPSNGAESVRRIPLREGAEVHPSTPALEQSPE